MTDEQKEAVRQLLREELTVEVYGGTTYVAVRLLLKGEQIAEDEVTLDPDCGD